MGHVKKFMWLLALAASVAHAQGYPKSPIPPTISAHTILCNPLAVVGAPSQCTGAQINVLLSIPLNVANCGAVMDNRDNVTAYSTCRALTVAGGGTSGSIIDVPNGSESNSANPTGSGAGGVLWRYNGDVSNNNTSAPVIGKNVDEVENFSLITGKYFGRAASASGLGPIMRLDNNVSHSGGSGVRNTLQVNTTIKPNASPLSEYEWGILSQMDYQATNSAGQHTPLVGYLNKYGSSLTGLFGANVEFNDRTAQPTSVSGPGNTVEIDYQANNTDDGGNLNGLVAAGQGIRIGELIALIDSNASAPGWLGQTVTGGGEFVGTGSQTGTVLTIDAITNATCTGSSALTTLTCTGAAGSNFFVGETLTGTNVPANTTITKALTGTGGNGTYLLSTQPSPAISGTTVTGTPALHVGDIVYQPNEPSCQNPTNCEYIASLGTGSGGAGTYNMSASATVAGGTVLNASIPPSFGWGSKIGSQLGNYYFTLHRGYSVINATIGKAAFSCEYVLFATNADCVRMVGGGAIGFDISGASGIAAHRLLYDNSKLSYEVNGSTVYSVGDTGQITNTVATGTAPLVVASTTNVANLNASSLSGATFASPGPIGSGTPSTGAFTTLGSTAPLKVNSVAAPYTLFHWGMPLVLPGGGTFTTTPSAASGLTLTTALPNLAACSATIGCYMYFPANAICTATNCGGGTSQAAGAYYAQCADTTHCKVFNNRLDGIATGIPAAPGSPTSFGTITTSGAYVQTVNSRLVLTTVTVPAGAMGANGSLEIEYRASRLSAATTCKVGASYGGSDIGFVGVASVAWIAYKRSLQNLGDAASQAVFPISNGSPSDFTSVNTGASFTSVNSASSQSLTVEGLITASATEWLVVYGVDVNVNNAT